MSIHADRGGQYPSAACPQPITDAGGWPGFRRPGKPDDNAQAEAGWRTLTPELLPRPAPVASLEEAPLEAADYLDTSCKLDHRPCALLDRAPPQFEQHFRQNLSYLTVRFYQTSPNDYNRQIWALSISY